MLIKRSCPMDKTVLITGATSGIGRATAEAFAKAGYNLALCGRREEKLAEIKEGLHLQNVDVYTFALDVTNRVMVEEKIAEMFTHVDHIDVLVNNAGLARGLDKYQESSIDDVEEMIDTNLKGIMYVTRAVLPSMLERNTGHVINMGSTAGIYAYAMGAAYCATKAAVKTFSDGLRIDTIDSDVKVTTIQPGIVETPFSEVRFHGDKERATTVYTGFEALQPEDIAEIIVFASMQPRRVQISDITIMACQQATGFTISKKQG